jgi:hypothetical protein
MNNKILMEGAKIEREHSKSLKKFLKPGVKIADVAKAIANDHLKEDINYYKKLSVIEGKQNKGLSQDNEKSEIKAALTAALPPYDKNGRTNFKLRDQPGVYVIFRGKKVIYVGFSKTNLYRTMYRHFQTWNDKTKQYRMLIKNLDNIKIAVIYCKGAKLAKLLENALILRYRPELNLNIYDGYIMDTDEKRALDLLGQLQPGIIEYKGDLPF